MTTYELLFRELNAAGVRYVVVGGLAVVLHGVARLTADIDLVVDLEAVEAAKAVSVLERAGLQPRAPVRAADFADPEVRQEWIRYRGSPHDPRRRTRRWVLRIPGR